MSALSKTYNYNHNIAALLNILLNVSLTKSERERGYC